MRDHRERPWMCWRCGFSMDTSTCMTHAGAAPAENDASLCLHCGAVYIRHGEAWQPISSIELALLSDDDKRMLDRMERLRQTIPEKPIKGGHA